jgi:carbohydrate kinase (thermoresistant glucokinase family)
LIKLSHFGDQTKQIVLACSALKRAYRLVLVGNKAPNEYRIFLLMTDRHTLEERLRNRKNHYAKASLLDSQFQALEMPSDDETNVTKIDVNGSVDETVQMIVDCLRD